MFSHGEGVRLLVRLYLHVVRELIHRHLLQRLRLENRHTVSTTPSVPHRQYHTVSTRGGRVQTHRALSHLLLHLVVHSKDGVGGVDLVQGVDLLHRVLELIHGVDLEPQHIAAGLGAGETRSHMIT